MVINQCFLKQKLNAYIKLINFIFKSGADINELKDENGKTALIFACEHTPCREIIECLLKKALINSIEH